MKDFYKEYEFSNGIVVTFQLDDGQPSAQWSCDITKENIEPIFDEYVHDCVPWVYQEMADHLGQPIMWVDPNGYYMPQAFTPRR